jgi:hypothetical protein
VLAGSVGDGFNGELMKVSGSPPIPVQEIVSALYIVSVSFLVAAVASILVVRVRSREKDAPHDVEPQQEAEKTLNEQSNRA